MKKKYSVGSALSESNAKQINYHYPVYENVDVLCYTANIKDAHMIADKLNDKKKIRSKKG